MMRTIYEEWKDYGVILLNATAPVTLSRAKFSPVTLPRDKRVSLNAMSHTEGQSYRSRHNYSPTERKRLATYLPRRLWPKLKTKIDAAKSYPSEYLLKLVQADLCLPSDEAEHKHSRAKLEHIAALTSILTRQNHVFSQIANALTEGKPCPVTREEIDMAWSLHAGAIDALVKLGFD